MTDKYGNDQIAATHMVDHFGGPTALETLPETETQAPQRADIARLTVKDVASELDRLGLFLEPRLIAKAVAALRSGKHVMLSGPPGTGKTTFAEALVAAAQRLGICTGGLPATATADWTSSDTVGTYRLRPPDELEFRPGQLLQSIDEDRWMIIDEFNRADIDKAIGQLFTVLSGQSVVLPYLESREGRLLAPSIVPPGADAPPNSHPHRVSYNWRMIVTLNDRDRDLLFEMSEALIRRFAVIEVDPPTEARWLDLLSSRAKIGHPQLDAALLRLSRLPGRQLGPAILIDCADYLKARLVVAEEEAETISADLLLEEAMACYIEPHLENVRESHRKQLDAYLAQIRAQLLDEPEPGADAATAAEASSDVSFAPQRRSETRLNFG